MSKLAAQLKKGLEIAPEEISRIAANALITLAYQQNRMYDKHDNKIIYFDPTVETWGAETWNVVYQAILSWIEIKNGIELTIEVREKNYDDDHIDKCVDRVRNIWKEICKIVERSKTLTPQDVPYKAKFARLADLQKEGYILEGSEKLDSKTLANSFLLGRFEDSELRLPERMTQRHVLVCGPTGSGKTMFVFVPNLVERTSTSAIVTEAVSGNKTPVLYGSTAGWRAKAGHEIIYFNPADLTSSRINPIDQVRNFQDAQHLAHLIVTNTTTESHTGDQIWAQSERHLLQSLLLHAASFRKDINKQSEMGDNANLGYIRRLLREGAEGMLDELSNTRTAIARREYRAYLNNTSPNFRNGIMSGLMMRLDLFTNSTVAALTEVTDFSLNELKNKLFTIYLATPVHMSEYTPLAVTLFNFSLSMVLKDLDQFKHPLTIIADEFTNFGYLPDMPRYMTVIRNAGIGITLGVQDPVQLERVYKEKDARILFGQPRTKIFFAPADDLVAVRLSKMLGTKTEREDVSASGGLLNREIPRPLIDASELMRLEKEQKYICLTSTETIKLDPIKSWEVYQGPMGYEPPARATIEVDENYYESKEANSPPPWIAGVPIPEEDRYYPRTERSRQPSPNIDSKESKGDREEESPWDEFSRKACEEPEHDTDRGDTENG